MSNYYLIFKIYWIFCKNLITNGKVQKLNLRQLLRNAYLNGFVHMYGMLSKLCFAVIHTLRYVNPILNTELRTLIVTEQSEVLCINMGFTYRMVAFGAVPM